MTKASLLKKAYHGIFIPALFLFILTSCNKKEEPKQQAGGRGMRGGPVSVDIRVVQPGFLQNVVQTTGTILPNETVELRPEVSGRVTGIFFTEGSFVEKGKLLVKINDADLQAQLKKMEAQEELLSDDEFRQRKLLEIKAISQEVYDAAQNQLRVLQAEKQLLLAQIAKTEIYAPFSGRIGLRAISPGSFVVSNTTVANLQQFDPVKIEFTVPEKYSSLIKDGMGIAFDTETSDSTYSGKVYARENSINADTRTLRVRALAPNRQQMLIPGKFARITLILETFPEALTVPSEAMVADMTDNLVFVCRNRKAVAVKVETGIRTEREIQVTSGLAPGDSLIVTGLMQITDGSPVLPKPSNP